MQDGINLSNYIASVIYFTIISDILYLPVLLFLIHWNIF